MRYSGVFLFCMVLLVAACKKTDFHDDIISNNDLEIDSSMAIPAEKQLRAYNEGNINEFIKHFSDSIKLFRMGSNQPFCSGKSDLKRVYGNLFKSRPELHCELINRTICGKYVIDEEAVKGLEDDRIVHAIAIYQIRDTLIEKAWFIKGE